MLPPAAPYKICNLIFSTEMLKNIVFQINLYANRDKNNENFKVLKYELQKLLGIFMLLRYHILPQEHRYGSTCFAC